MPGLDNIVGARITCYRSLHRASPVCRRNPGGHPFTSLDRDGEFGAKTTAVALHHQRQLQQLTALTGHGHTDQATAVLGHEIDSLGIHMLRRHHQVAFVFPVLVIHQNNHLSLTDIFDQFFNRVELHNGTRPFKPGG